ncbi:MAG: energy transducer TonB [Prevotella sp.]|nr:energy transducer TonB [Prevotella sp.]
MKKLFTIIAVCLMSLQFATAQDIHFDGTIQEQMPQFVGGEEALTDWIETNISYPLMADVNAVEGKVVVKFDIDEEGYIDNIQVEESADPLFAEEVVDKLQDMPQWIPAMQNGRCVKVRYTLPISFFMTF